MQQQLQLGQTLIDVMRRGNQQQQPQQPQQPPVGVPERERLTMDTKWIPAMPLPSFKQWVSRSRELSGFRDWAEKASHSNSVQKAFARLQLFFPGPRVVPSLVFLFFVCPRVVRPLAVCQCKDEKGTEAIESTNRRGRVHLNRLPPLAN